MLGRLTDNPRHLVAAVNRRVFHIPSSTTPSCNTVVLISNDVAIICSLVIRLQPPTHYSYRMLVMRYLENFMCEKLVDKPNIFTVVPRSTLRSRREKSKTRGKERPVQPRE